MNLSRLPDRLEFVSKVGDFSLQLTFGLLGRNFRLLQLVQVVVEPSDLGPVSNVY